MKIILFFLLLFQYFNQYFGGKGGQYKGQKIEVKLVYGNTLHNMPLICLDFFKNYVAFFHLFNFIESKMQNLI